MLKNNKTNEEIVKNGSLESSTFRSDTGSQGNLYTSSPVTNLLDVNLSHKQSIQILDDKDNICGVLEQHPEYDSAQCERDATILQTKENNIERKQITKNSNNNLNHIYSETRPETKASSSHSQSVEVKPDRESINRDSIYRNKKSSSQVGESTTSWNGTENIRLRHRRNRSQSWCANRPNASGFDASDVRLLRDRLVRTQLRVQPTVIKTFTRSQRLTLAVLAFVDFMSFCSMSIMAPFFPKESADKGMSDTVSGFVFSFYALVMFLSSPIFGKVLPIIGAKFLFISGMFIAGVCNVIFGTLQYLTDYTLFTVFCFLIRGLEALGASAFSTASYVFVVNHFPDNIGSVLGILETFVGLGMSVGPAIGGLLYSVGGFGLPFYVLGVAMVVTIPLNCCLLANDGDYTIGSKTGSILQLLKVPSVVITGLVIVVVSNTWAFLDPTLEPHLRQFDLSPEQIGLVFLLFSALYGLFSPIWGWLADRVSNHWCMMFWGLIFCTVGLLLLGPSPVIPGLQKSVWLNLVALSILGISVALTLLPTFQGVLNSSIEEGGCAAVLSTYSMVAGVWSCCYSLGEVLGPALGGALTQRAGFPLTTTIMAALCFFMALVTITFFTLKENNKLGNMSDTLSDTNSGSDSFKSSSLRGNESRITFDDDNGSSDETKPLLTNKEKKKSVGYESFTKEIVQKFENGSNQGHSKYYIGDNDFKDCEILVSKDSKNAVGENNFKKGKSGLYPTVKSKPSYQGIVSKSEGNSRRNSMEVIKHNFDKIKYYEQMRKDDFDTSNTDRNQVTDVKGTVNLTPSGACEV